ncbi:MAG TPA: hypothetical protein VL976_11890, partial [Xanthobacteraceae bacterium]|nr:hypothetical protein [Xanthobacteraceae bacterium]
MVSLQRPLLRAAAIMRRLWCFSHWRAGTAAAADCDCANTALVFRDRYERKMHVEETEMSD